MMYNMLQNDGSLPKKAHELARRLSDATGLIFRVGLEREISAKLVPLKVRVGDEFVNLVYVCPESGKLESLTARLLQVLAQEICDGLAGCEHDVPPEPWTWEKLLSIALFEQWDQGTFAVRAAACMLTGLSLGFPVLVNCSTWSPEVDEVMENLFPQARVHWDLKPGLFLYVPLDHKKGGLAEQRAYGESLIKQVHSLLADELGVSATVFVGQVIEEDLWTGFLEVRRLTELHRRFFIGAPGLAAWNVGIASLFLETRSVVGQDFRQTALGRLNKELLETLKIFLEKDMNITDSARALFIHRNTLTYRLDRITDLTGHNPRRLQGAVHLFMALWLSNHMN